MSTPRFLTSRDLQTLVEELRKAGTRVVAPRKVEHGTEQALEYRPIDRLKDAVLTGTLPSRSLKELFLPPTEPLFRWRQKGGDVEIDEVRTAAEPTVVLGASPCDTAAVAAVDKVMGWDYRDDLWFGRREATTIVSLACSSPDRSCFCTAVGLGPDSGVGADVLLVPLEGGFVAEVLTPRGEKLLGARGKEHTDAAPVAEARRKARERVAKNVDATPEKIRAWLESHFEHDLWRRLALRCHGCGACASLCPTCHCFDIVDEPNGLVEGTRRRNWDTCQTARFTVHGSGHNPRADQNARFRQRVMHKFAIYPSRFGQLLCTGCGRCARACPGGMDLPELLNTLARLAGGESARTGGAA